MSSKFIDTVSGDRNVRTEVAEAIRSVVKDEMPRSRPEIRALVERIQRDARLRTKVSTAIAGVAARHGSTFQADEACDRELSEQELELLSGGPTMVEYAVLFTLVIDVCLGSLDLAYGGGGGAGKAYGGGGGGAGK